MEIFDNIKEIIAEAEEDVSKFYENGNKAAAVRIRKAMQDVKKLAQDLRNHVQETKNNL
jgi:rubrerythrin